MIPEVLTRKPINPLRVYSGNKVLYGALGGTCGHITHLQQAPKQLFSGTGGHLIRLSANLHVSHVRAVPGYRAKQGFFLRVSEMEKDTNGCEKPLLIAGAWDAWNGSDRDVCPVQRNCCGLPGDNTVLRNTRGRSSQRHFLCLLIKV